MFQSHNPPPEISTRQTVHLPRRDYFLLPLISLATIAAMLFGAEAAARRLWPEQKTNSCAIDGGTRFKPNCTVRLKNAEGPWVTYRFNDCGYRSMNSCRTKPPAALRIVVIGSSMSYGLWVPYEQMYFSLASRELTRICHRPVDTQNLSAPALIPLYTSRRVEEALALEPDVVLYVFGPWDVEQKTTLSEPAKPALETPRQSEPPIWSKAALRQALHRRFNAVIRLLGLDPKEIAIDPWSHLRAVRMADHFLFQDRGTYLRTTAPDKDDYLKTPFPPAWQQRFANFDTIVGNMADKLRAAGIPLLLIPVPSRKQAAFFNLQPRPPHIDPFAFGRQIESIAARHGAQFLDLTPALSTIPSPENLYYVVDGHPTAGVQEVIAHSLVQKLQDGSVPAFSRCAASELARQEP